MSPDQIAALQKIGAWYRSQSDDPLTLGGYAGTGKTTLVAYVRKALRENFPGSRVAFCAFTGKAVRVLDQTLRANKVSRGSDSMSTIHGLIYHSEVDKQGHITGWRKKSTLEFDLIIVDEASMVTEDIWRDLLSYEIPILAVGDHGQLPPVGSSFNLMAEPQIRLERIFRQEQNSPIVEVATLARTTGLIPAGSYGKGVVKYDRRSDDIGVAMDELLQQWKPDWLVLCGYNHTRVKLNHSLRSQMGIESEAPTVGDHLICLRNNASAKLYNGMTGTLQWLKDAENDDERRWYHAGVAIDELEHEGFLLREQFGAKATIGQVPPAPDGTRGDLFDFGYALTVHKAQGSQADTVLLFEERNKHMSDEDWQRWLYTAVTRAERQLFIVGD
jgi:exodeoxyribonuclease-5